MTYTLGQGEGGAKFASSLDYTNPTLMRLTSPQGWASGDVPGGQVGFLKGPTARDELGQYRITAQRPLQGFFSRLETGAAFTRRSKYKYEAGPTGKEGFFLALKNGATSAPLPPSVGITDLSFIGIKGMISYDPLAAFNSGIYNLIPNNNPAYAPTTGTSRRRFISAT
jgi:iron complex outermembrane receptor protein